MAMFNPTQASHCRRLVACLRVPRTSALQRRFQRGVRFLLRHVLFVVCGIQIIALAFRKHGIKGGAPVAIIMHSRQDFHHCTHKRVCRRERASLLAPRARRKKRNVPCTVVSARLECILTPNSGMGKR